MEEGPPKARMCRLLRPRIEDDRVSGHQLQVVRAVTGIEEDLVEGPIGGVVVIPVQPQAGGVPEVHRRGRAPAL